MRGMLSHRFVLPLGVTLLVGVVLLLTRVPSLYTLDSAEFVTSAYALGFAHAPGYPLYMVMLHLFIGLGGAPDAAGNLFSVLTLMLTVPFTYLALVRLLPDRWAAAAATLITFWSYYIWVIGLFTEVYAPQLLTVAITVYVLAYVGTVKGHEQTRWALWSGVAFGVAVAMHPVSALFAPALVLVLRGSGVSWKHCVLAAGLSLVFAVAPLIYFPIRYAQLDSLAINLAGAYNAEGVFEAVPLNTIGGILWLLSGRQFDWLFFTNTRPLLDSLLETLGWFFQGFLGIGFVIGVLGIWRVARREKRLLIAWLALFMPYTLFFATYGAPDRALMLGPGYWLWALPLAFGLAHLRGILGTWRGAALLVALPLLTLAIHFPLLNLSRDTSVRERAQVVIDYLPENAILFGAWTGITPVEYLHVVEGQRPDVRIYNLFLFQPGALAPYVTSLAQAGERVMFLDSDGIGFVFPDAPEWQGISVDVYTIQTVQPDQPSVVLYRIIPR